MSKVFPIGYEMAEKNANTHTHTDTHFRIFISRDKSSGPQALEDLRDKKYLKNSVAFNDKL